MLRKYTWRDHSLGRHTPFTSAWGLSGACAGIPGYPAQNLRQFSDIQIEASPASLPCTNSTFGGGRKVLINNKCRSSATLARHFYNSETNILACDIISRQWSLQSWQVVERWQEMLVREGEHLSNEHRSSSPSLECFAWVWAASTRDVPRLGPDWSLPWIEFAIGKYLKLKYEHINTHFISKAWK